MRERHPEETDEQYELITEMLEQVPLNRVRRDILEALNPDIIICGACALVGEVNKAYAVLATMNVCAICLATDDALANDGGKPFEVALCKVDFEALANDDFGVCPHGVRFVNSEPVLVK